MPSKNSEELARNLAVADLEGLYQKHTQMWDMFHNTLKIYGAVMFLPLIVLGTLVTAGKYDLAASPTLAALPMTAAVTILVAGLLGLVLLLTLIRNRLDIILYARGINAFRAMYVSLLNKDRSLKGWRPSMPVSADAPKAFEIWRPMGHIVITTALLNDLYTTIGVYKCFGLPSFLLVLTFFVLFFFLQVLLYRKSCDEKFVLGSHI